MYFGFDCVVSFRLGCYCGVSFVLLTLGGGCVFGYLCWVYPSSLLGGYGCAFVGLFIVLLPFWVVFLLSSAVCILLFLCDLNLVCLIRFGLDIWFGLVSGVFTFVMTLL